MRLIRIEPTEHGFFLDPTPYLDQLARLSAELPPGAAAFANDPGHYDFHSSRCPKDLKLDRMTLTDSTGKIDLELSFVGYRPEPLLVIGYTGVTDLRVEAIAGTEPRQVWPETRRLGSVQLDEILPNEQGCSHEIKLINGTVTVISADLFAEWREPVS